MLTLLWSIYVFSLVDQSTTKFPWKRGLHSRYIFALVRPNGVKTGLRQGASSRALRGRLRRAPPPPAGGGARGSKASLRPVHCSGPMYWHLSQPAHTVLAQATRAPPYKLRDVFLFRRLQPGPPEAPPPRPPRSGVEGCKPHVVHGRRRMTIRGPRIPTAVPGRSTLGFFSNQADIGGFFCVARRYMHTYI